METERTASSVPVTFALCTGERIMVHVDEFGHTLRIISDRNTIFIEPSASNSLVIATDKSMAARKEAWAKVRREREQRKQEGGNHG